MDVFTFQASYQCTQPLLSFPGAMHISTDPNFEISDDQGWQCDFLPSCTNCRSRTQSSCPIRLCSRANYRVVQATRNWLVRITLYTQRVQAGLLLVCTRWDRDYFSSPEIDIGMVKYTNSTLPFLLTNKFTRASSPPQAKMGSGMKGDNDQYSITEAQLSQ